MKKRPKQGLTRCASEAAPVFYAISTYKIFVLRRGKNLNGKPSKVSLPLNY